MSYEKAAESASKAEHRCSQGYVLRWLEWGSHDEECLGSICPHPIMCPVKRRAVAAESERGH